MQRTLRVQQVILEQHAVFITQTVTHEREK